MIEELSEIIKTKRKEKRWSQVDLANAVGVSQQHISRIEKGINVPSVTLFYRISQVLEADPNELLEQAGIVASRNLGLIADVYKIFRDLSPEDRQLLAEFSRLLRVRRTDYIADSIDRDGEGVDSSR